MTSRGILFQPALVRAILAGTKHQTRRIVKNPPRHWSKWQDCDGAWHLTGYTQVRPSHDGLFIQSVDHMDPRPATPCPYGVPGDRLWVRETWGFDSGVRADFRPAGRHDLSGMDLLSHTLYRADMTELAPKPPRWRPAIHMPRWASRITLEVTEVRAERLQQLTEEDAIAEGVTTDPQQGLLNGKPATLHPITHRQAFIWLWDRINGAKAPWSSNPWAWVLTFKRVEVSRA